MGVQKSIWYSGKSSYLKTVEFAFCPARIKNDFGTLEKK